MAAKAGQTGCAAFIQVIREQRAGRVVNTRGDLAAA
jgi:hypothetical protein